FQDHPFHAVASSSFSDYERVLLQPLPTKHLHHIEKAVVTVPKSTKSELAESHLRSLLNSHPILMPFRGISIRLPGHSTVLSLTPDLTTIGGSTRLCFVADENTTLTFKEQETDLDNLLNAHKDEEKEKEKEKFVPFEREPDDMLFDLPWQKSLTLRLLSWLDTSSSSPFFDGRCVLITGPSGSGKTEQLRSVAHAAALSERAFCTHLMDGTSLKGRSAENIEKSLSVVMDNLISRSPSILLIDNLDLIASSQEEETRIVPVERVFTVLWRLLHSRRGVHVICSSRRLTSIHSSLIGSGKRFFQRIENIEGLTQSSREEVLRLAIESTRKKGEESMNSQRRPSNSMNDDWSSRIEEATRAMENASVDELVRVVRRCEIEAFMPGRDGIITPSDLVKVASEWRKKGESESAKGGRVEKTLKDVGGMHQQKKLMQEVMLWPYKYSSLFSRFRIRLGRGIILHGPSGCGKTLLAQAMVAESGFNLISVKGPELLSKYIGSSEENVRAVFERARAAAPSVLFFDEIDSLAPRRGSDTSGVSDRVVNQLLTEMDGAEGLTGVFVLGSTSRLDLIDEALIRPGRFDYSIHCGPPDQQDRVEILHVLLREMRKGMKKIDLSGISKSTEGWTGADLKTLTTNAFFRAQEEMRESSGDDESVCVSLDHLNEVMEESKPRMRRSEKGLGIERNAVGITATQA
ncbi:hypothetical protein PFISCL1PPCAC_24294, partial [Pristionchus fissidentatus]